LKIAVCFSGLSECVSQTGECVQVKRRLRPQELLQWGKTTWDHPIRVWPFL